MNGLQIAAIAAGILLSACDLESPQVLPHDSGQTLKSEVTLSITAATGTRSAGKDWSDSGLSSLKAFVFNSDKTLDSYGESSDSPKVTLNCSSGSGKSIYVIANYPRSINVTTSDELRKEVSMLTDNSPGGFVMTGFVEGKVINSSESISVPVSRIAAKVSIDRIVNNLNESIYKSKKFVITGIFLINAPVGKYPVFSSGYSPDSWTSKSAHTPSEYDAYTFDSIRQEIGIGEEYSRSHVFYVYPNPTVGDSNGGEWTPRKTRLVIQAEIGGEICWYPLTLNEVAKNTHYRFTSLRITRRGSASPDEPVTSSEAVFSVDVSEWNTTDMGDMTI